MHDIKFIRKNSLLFDESLTKRKDLEDHKDSVHKEIKNKYYEDSN